MLTVSCTWTLRLFDSAQDVFSRPKFECRVQMDGFVGDSEVMKVNQIAKMEFCGIPALTLNN